MDPVQPWLLFASGLGTGWRLRNTAGRSFANSLVRRSGTPRGGRRSVEPRVGVGRVLQKSLGAGRRREYSVAPLQRLHVERARQLGRQQILKIGPGFSAGSPLAISPTIISL